MSRDLRSIEQVMKALGGGDVKAGRKELIRITGRSTQHVTNWLSEGNLPRWTWLVVSSALARTGHRMHPDVCGMAPLSGKTVKRTASG